ncbi:MAG: hypothetical protein KF811_10815 [Dokdonella sp.]|nr:hypothetical protein [Dokdonella sp.]
MDSFRWIAVAISMVLGIGVTRLLSSAVMILRNRRDFEFDFLPVAWAAFVFVAQIQFWWSIIELSTTMSVWTLGNFLLLLSMPLLLFVAAALVLPYEPRKQDLALRIGFERDGRLSLLALALYNALACVADAVWWSENLLSAQGTMLVALAILPLWLFFVSRRPLQISITGLYGLLLIVCELELTPSSYH